MVARKAIFSHKSHNMQTEKNKDVDVTAAFESNGRVVGIIRKFTNNSVHEVKVVVLVNRVQFATHASILIKEKLKLLHTGVICQKIHYTQKPKHITCTKAIMN